MRIRTFDDVNIAIGCIASCLLCVSASIRSDEKPQDDTIANAVFYLSTQAFDLEKDMDIIISKNLAEKKMLEKMADMPQTEEQKGKAAAQQPTPEEVVA